MASSGGVISNKVSSAASPGNGKLTLNLLFLVTIVTFGTSFPLGYCIAALNGPQLVIVNWIRSVRCHRFNHVNGTYGNGTSADKWCGPLDRESASSMLNANAELNTLWAMTSAFFPLGGLIAAFTSRILADRYGLKRSILISAGVLLAGTALGSFSHLAGSFEMLIVGRIITGLAAGSGIALTPMYTAEVTPVALRGALGTMHPVMQIVGMTTATAIGLPFVLGNEWGWQVLIALHLVPVGLMCTVLPFCPESPKHLLIEGRDRVEVERALVWLRGTANVQEELAAIEKEHVNNKARVRVSLFGIFRDPFLRSTLLIAAVAMSALHLSGYSCLSAYSTYIFTAAGLTRLNSIYASLGLWSVFLCINLIALILVDKCGRRPLLLISHAGVLVALCFLIVTMTLTRQGYGWTKYASVAAIFGFIISHGTGLFSVPFVLGPELFTQEARTAAVTWISAVCWVTVLAVTLLFPLVTAVAHEFTFIIFIGFLVLTGSFTYWKLPETKGKSVDEIQLVLRDRFGK